MEAIGLYLLKSAAWLTGFALVYLLVLRNERYFRLNRFFLLTGIVASLLFPFYTFHYTVVIPSVPTDFASVGELVAGGVIADEPAVPFYYWIYLTGIIAFFLRVLFQTWKIYRKLREIGFERTGNVKLVRTPDYSSSFSFFSYVFVNPSTSAHEMEEIMNHEREHIRQRHWFDLLLVELICMVQWFNPFAWVYAHLVRQNHEYLADESALQRTVDPVVYQAALLNQLLGAPVFSLTNSFSYSLNKKRFKMMKKKIDSPFRKLKVLVVLPLAAMLFYAFAMPEYQYETSATNVVADDNKLDIKGQVQKSDGTPLAGTSVILRNSSTGTITDKDGNFMLKSMPADGELVFSFVGFTTVVRKISAQPMTITMEVGKVGIEQVTVVGYGTPPPPPPPPPRNLAKEMNGPNPPLVIVDGVEITKEAFSQINPDQIESMNVLKGKRGTELYGEKGKNGVILISTKGKDTKGTGEKSGNEEVVVVGYGKNPSDQKSTSSKVVIRSIDSANPPLIFLDGIPITKAAMDQLDPETFKSISVLKEKSATEVYGERAKNGVILINTKAKANSLNPTNSDQQSEVKTGKDAVFVVVEEMPEFPGKEIALRDFIAKTVKYPADAMKDSIQGRVFVTFVVKSDGTVGDAKIARGVHPSLDQEAIRVVNALPTWKPGKQRGVAVNVAYTIPVQFALDGGKNAQQALLFPPMPKTPPQRPDGVFVVVEEMPEFPGGPLALRELIAKTIKYPADALKDSIQGKVFVTFVVKADGSIGSIKIARGVHPSLDKEALRVVCQLPTWKPGKQGGKAVDVSYTVPIQFTLGKLVTQTVSFVPPQINKKGEKEVFVVVEQMPEFPGGSQALRIFVGQSIRYPAEAQKEKVQGKVLVSFVVSSTGKVENAKIERSVSPALDAEAIRVVNQMPDWKPGMQRGQAVSVEYTIPIEFKLQ